MEKFYFFNLRIYTKSYFFLNYKLDYKIIFLLFSCYNKNVYLCSPKQTCCKRSVIA